MDSIKEAISAIFIGSVVAVFLGKTGRVLQAIEVYKECLIILHSQARAIDSSLANLIFRVIYLELICAYDYIKDYTSTEKYLRELLLYLDSNDTAEKGRLHLKLADILQKQSKLMEAWRFYESAINIMKTMENRHGEASSYGNLGTLFRSLGQYDKAREFQEKALAINIEIGDRDGEATSYGNLGTLFQSLGQYDKAREYQEKALAIKIEIGDRHGEARSYGNLGTLFQSLGQYDKAREYQEKALAINIEIGDREGEATSYGNLGTLFQSLGQYDKAREYQEKALAIKIEIGDRDGEATIYGNLGTLFQSLGQYDKAREYQEKALAIKIEIGDRHGEATSYGNLGTLFQSLGQYDKAREYQEKALAITIEIGDRDGEATSYGNLGTLFQSLGQYDKAREYQEKALAIKIEIGDRHGEASSYGNLGTLFRSLGQYDKAREYQEKALAINIEIGDRDGEATSYGNLGTLFQSLGQYDKAREYQEKALAIKIEIGDRHGEASSYGNLGTLFRSLGQYDKAREFQEKALAINIEIGDRHGEATSYGNLGTLFQSLGQYDKAREYQEKALAIKIEIGDRHGEFECLCNLSVLIASQGHLEEASSYLFQGIQKFETLRGFLKENDEFQISLLEKYGTFPYKLFSRLLSSTGKPEDALYVEELRRARGLADLMTAQYSVQEQISSDPKSWCGIQGIIRKETDSACLYISVGGDEVRFWIIKATGAILFSEKKVNLDPNKMTGIVPEIDEFFKELMSLRRNDRSGLHYCDTEDFKTSLHLCYNIIIAPVASLLKQPEIIIVPDSCVYQVPFAALADEGGKYLSETCRIRLVPSLTTLKLVQDSPPDYHSQTGALVVGDPVVRTVIYKGRCRNMIPLPYARKEAEMIGTLLGVRPLIGESATKHSVLQAINSVSLIHIAAHGDPERGEIALSPEHPTLLPPFPSEEEYLLTMADISKTRLRAKLVVLSCCHSARGQIRTEGVIGIARAFLGSGARSVLAARWALDDTATEQFMTCFYKHLYRGESASESLQKARKWMRNNGFDKVSQWAPFMIMGDNVTFDFGNWPVPSAP
ncbi:tetratricopeptide repeat protein 28-like [Pocillopora verrucosa]|uniref:tetratricopeptide repeat protein 28-like n=1 Tax=Pocillopora verrucosa TaxID=203993 RepID=UPI00333F5D63